MNPPGERPVQGIRDSVRDVLDRPEYRRPAKSLLDRLRELPVDILDRVLNAFLGGGRGAWLAWVILAVAVVGSIVVAVRFAGGVTRDGSRPLGSSSPRRRSAADWRAEAEAAERAGKWRLALRARYRALVADLADAGLVEDVAGRTAGEYRVEVAGNAPAAAAPFAGATEIFERAWYGQVETGADDAARFRELADDVLEGAGR